MIFNYSNRIKEFTDAIELQVFCGTWNVCNKRISDGSNVDLSHWLLPDASKASADMYAVGFQEIVDLNVNNVVIDGSKSDTKATYWVSKGIR